MLNTEENKQSRYDRAYLRLASSWAKLSHCQRKQVGAIIVKDAIIISDGYNMRGNATTATQTLTLYGVNGGQNATGQYNS